MTAHFSTLYHNQSNSPLDHFKKIITPYKELKSLFEIFQGSKDELSLIESVKAKHWLSKEGFKAINDTRTLFWKYTLEKLGLYSDPEVLEKNEELSVRVVVNVFDVKLGVVPVIGIPERIIKEETVKPWFQQLANNSFAALGFVSPEEEKHTMFWPRLTTILIPHNYMIAYLVLGYAFAFARPEDLGGQENFSVCFVIKYPEGYEKETQKERGARYDTLQEHLNPILDGMRLIRDLMKEMADVDLIRKVMENVRNFYTYAMIHPNEVKSEEGDDIHFDKK